MTNNKTTLRKLKLQVQMSIDGYIAGPDGEMDWLVWNWDDNLKEHLNELTVKMSTMFQKSPEKRVYNLYSKIKHANLDKCLIFKLRKSIGTWKDSS
jgi:hypothetical protein